MKKLLLAFATVLLFAGIAGATPTPTATPTPSNNCANQYFGPGAGTNCMPDAAASPGAIYAAPTGSDPVGLTPNKSVWVLPLFTLSGGTPTLQCEGGAGIYDTNYEVLTGNVTAITTPANGVCPKGKIIHVIIQQSASGGPFTVVAVASWTAGSGTTFGVAAGLSCTIGSTQGATGTASAIDYDLVNGGPAGADDWQVLACPTVR